MILFDLDGTLVDTAPDLGFALNLQRERHGLAPLTMEAIRPYASHGSKGLLGLGFGVTPDDKSFEEMRIEYLDLYHQVFTRSPAFFDGVSELLTVLEQSGVSWGVVTNKAAPKPAPDTLFLACEQASVVPSECFYVGDAERDIEAGNAAGMKTVVALWGYLDKSDRPMDWGANFAINHPSELRELISKSNHLA
jgi:phosphoglycolate phosphatase